MNWSNDSVPWLLQYPMPTWRKFRFHSFMANLQTPYDSRVIANSFIEIARQRGSVIDPMKLQKLVYIAHGWYLAFFNRPLIIDDVQAWKYGPVIPRLYDMTKRFGLNPVSEYYTEFNENRLSMIPFVKDSDMKFLELIWQRYGSFNGVELSVFTHREDTPWKQVYDETRRNMAIPTEAIRQYYKKLSESTRANG